MRLILSKAQFAAFVPRVIEIVKNAQTKRKSLITPFCGDGEALKPALDHLEKALAYNLVGGKMTRGLMAAEIYYALLIGQTGIGAVFRIMTSCSKLVFFSKLSFKDLL